MKKQNATHTDNHRGLRFLDLVRLSLRSFRAKPSRTLLTILGMSLGIGAVLFLVSLGYGLQYILVGRLVSTEDSLITIEAYFPTESNLAISKADLEKVMQKPHVAEVSPIAELTGEVMYKEASGFVVVKAVDGRYFRLSGEGTTAGAPLANGATRGGVVVSTSVLKLIGVIPPDFDIVQQKDALASYLGTPLNFSIFFQDEDGVTISEITPLAEPLKIAGIIADELQAPFAYVSYADIPKPIEHYRRLLVKSESAEVIEKVRDALVDQGFLISARIDLVKQATKIMNAITVVLAIFGITALVVAAVGMFNTMLVSFLERIFEIGIIKALGATNRDVRNIFLVESFVMGFAGGISGIALGIGSTELFNFLLNLLSKHLGGAKIELFITPFWFMGLILGVASLIGIFSGFWPARKASSLSPKEAFTKR